MSVKVAIRVRPLLSEDDPDHSLHSIEYIDRKSIIVAGEKQFTSDVCFRDDALQTEVYSEFVSPLVTKFLSGQNCSVLTYGQTGSGKTYKMGSDYTGTPTTKINDNTGIIPRILSQMFEESKKEFDPFSFKVSFLEVINDTVFDILSQPRSAVQVQDGGKQVLINSLCELEVENTDDALELLSKGVRCRSQAATGLNAYSSRSHAFFIVKMQRQTENSFIESTLHLVDLAGSENSKRANTKGERFVEGVSINKSLLFLGKVIAALSSKSAYIPYRNHVLTRILRETLNGSSFMRMIACINSNVKSIPETINTLRYASSARNIPHHTLPRVGKENKFLAQLQDVLPTPKKFSVPITPLGNSASLDFSMSSVKRDFSLPLLSSTIIRPPPPKFNISPEKPIEGKDSVPLATVESILSPLATKISNMLHRRISETVQRCIPGRMSQSHWKGPSLDLEEGDENECCDTLLAPESRNVDQEKISQILSPIVSKIQKRMEESMSQRFMKLEKNLAMISKNMNSLPAAPIINQRADFITESPDIVPGGNLPEKVLKKASTNNDLPSNPLNGIHTSPVKTRRRTVIELNAGIRTSPVKTRRRTMAELTDTCMFYMKTRRRTLMDIGNIPVPPAPVPLQMSPVVQKKKQLGKQQITFSSEAVQGKVDAREKHRAHVLEILNRGSMKQLQMLPAIGPKTAYMINTYRSLYGDFQSVEEVKEVGLSCKMYNRFLKGNQLICSNQQKGM